MKKNISLWLSLTLFFYACNDNKEKLIIDSLISALEKSTNQINKQTENDYKSIKERKSDILLHNIADLWEPKALQISEVTKNIVKDLGKFKNDYNETKILRIENVKTKLKLYVDTITQIIPDRNRNYASELMSDSNSFFKADINKNNFISQIAKLENEIALLQNKLITYCKVHISKTWDDFSIQTSVFINQNTKHLKPGDTLIVKAGIGAFSKAANPKVKINNLDLKVEEDGVSTYILKASSDIGIHKIPVYIEFIQMDGKREKGQFFVEYSID